MILRTLLFFVLLYFLVKVLSRLFLPSSDRQKRSRRQQTGFDFFYQHFNNQSGSPKQRQSNNRSSGNIKNRLDQIEEAEYEEVNDKDEDLKNSKPE